MMSQEEEPVIKQGCYKARLPAVYTWSRSRTAHTNLGPLHIRDWDPVTVTLQALSLAEKAEPVQVRCFTLRLRDRNGVCELQDGCKVYMDSYVALNGSYCMVTWNFFNNHLLGVGLTKNQEKIIDRLGNMKTLNCLHIYSFILKIHMQLMDNLYMSIKSFLRIEPFNIHCYFTIHLYIFFCSRSCMGES